VLGLTAMSRSVVGGVRTALLAGMVLYGVGGLGTAAAPELWFAALARLISGIARSRARRQG